MRIPTVDEIKYWREERAIDRETLDEEIIVERKIDRLFGKENADKYIRKIKRPADSKPLTKAEKLDRVLKEVEEKFPGTMK